MWISCSNYKGKLVSGQLHAWVALSSRKQPLASNERVPDLIWTPWNTQNSPVGAKKSQQLLGRGAPRLVTIASEMFPSHLAVQTCQNVVWKDFTLHLYRRDREYPYKNTGYAARDKILCNPHVPELRTLLQSVERQSELMD
jgi:hypothetical protein